MGYLSFFSLLEFIYSFDIFLFFYFFGRWRVWGNVMDVMRAGDCGV